MVSVFELPRNQPVLWGDNILLFLRRIRDILGTGATAPMLSIPQIRAGNIQMWSSRNSCLFLGMVRHEIVYRSSEAAHLAQDRDDISFL